MGVGGSTIDQLPEVDIAAVLGGLNTFELDTLPPVPLKRDMNPRLPALAVLCCKLIRLSFSAAASVEEARPFSYLLAWERTFELADAILAELALGGGTVLVDSVSFSELLPAGELDPPASAAR